MKDKYYYGSMFICNGIIIFSLTAKFIPELFMKSLLYGWSGYMIGYGLIKFFIKEQNK